MKALIVYGEYDNTIEQEAVTLLTAMGYDIINEGCNPIQESGKTTLKHLTEQLTLIVDVDLVLFTGTWHAYKECQIEYECCLHYGVKVAEFRST